MSRKKFIYRMVCIVLALTMMMFTGCSNKEPDAVDIGTTSQPKSEKFKQKEKTEEEAVRVYSMKGLIDAVRPGAKIIIESGRYCLSDYINEVITKAGNFEKWNESQKFVQIREVYDGYELVFNNVSGLSISGATDKPSDTEIVTNPRYATVLNFEDSNDVKISGLTLGHTDMGDCEGDVLGFEYCEKIALKNMNLYGCGVYGIFMKFCKDALIEDSVIHDCNFGPFNIVQSIGNIEFSNCKLIDSDGPGYYEYSKNLNLLFKNCEFGDFESEWQFSDEIQTENCKWSKECACGEGNGEFMVSEFDINDVKIIALENAGLTDEVWIGYLLIDKKTAKEERIYGVETPDDEYKYITVDFFDGGEGIMSYLGDDIQFKWSAVDETTVRLDFADNSVYASTFAMSDGSVWLYIDYTDTLIWLFKLAI